MAVENNRNFNTPDGGIDNYGDMFSNRQLYMLQNLNKQLTILKEELGTSDYLKTLYIYLAIWYDRIA